MVSYAIFEIVAKKNVFQISHKKTYNFQQLKESWLCKIHSIALKGLEGPVLFKQFFTIGLA